MTTRSEVNQYGLGKLEMNSITGGGPAPSTLQTENIDWTYRYVIFVSMDANGDSYPDDCCE